MVVINGLKAPVWSKNYHTGREFKREEWWLATGMLEIKILRVIKVIITTKSKIWPWELVAKVVKKGEEKIAKGKIKELKKQSGTGWVFCMNQVWQWKEGCKSGVKIITKWRRLIRRLGDYYRMQRAYSHIATHPSLPRTFPVSALKFLQPGPP